MIVKLFICYGYELLILPTILNQCGWINHLGLCLIVHNWPESICTCSLGTRTHSCHFQQQNLMNDPLETTAAVCEWNFIPKGRIASWRWQAIIYLKVQKHWLSNYLFLTIYDFLWKKRCFWSYSKFCHLYFPNIFANTSVEFSRNTQSWQCWQLCIA